MFLPSQYQKIEGSEEISDVHVFYVLILVVNTEVDEIRMISSICFFIARYSCYRHQMK